jgi:hypothetical protein
LPRPEPPVRAEAPEPAPKAAPPPASQPSEPKPSTEPVIDDEAAIRAVVAAYARAIESKDLALFRRLKPNLGAEEERRIERGFRAVTTQKVDITILSIDRRGDRAVAQLRRQDVIEAGGRRHTPESRQTMTLAKTNGTWVIVEIGG